MLLRSLFYFLIISQKSLKEQLMSIENNPLSLILANKTGLVDDVQVTEGFR